MNFTSELNARAREIREEAAKRFGGVAEDYNWNEAVSLACKGFEFKKEMAQPEQALFDARAKLAMAVDRAYNPNNRSVNNIFRGLTAKEDLEAFDNEHPEVKEFLDAMFSDDFDDDDDDYEYSSGGSDL